MNGHAQSILKRPIVTERSNILRERDNKYTFEVDPKATKIDIKRAVEEIFNTKVLDVKVMHVHGKPRRVRLAIGKRRNWKKAVVTIEAGQTISIFEGV